jgi:putative oxidoreductase
MNWFGKQKGEGFEYHLLAIAIAAVLVLRGGGKWAADKAIENSLRVAETSRATVSA